MFKALKYFRIFVPSWRFFDDTGPIPKLYVRAEQAGQLGSSWLPALQPPKRRWYSLFFNPDGNLHHAICNALEHLLHDPQDKDANRIIHRYVRHYLINERGLKPLGKYQFKVTAVQFKQGEIVDEEESLLSTEEDL